MAAVRDLRIFEITVHRKFGAPEDRKEGECIGRGTHHTSCEDVACLLKSPRMPIDEPFSQVVKQERLITIK